MPDRLHGYYCSVMQGIQILLEKDSFIDCTLAAEGRFVNAHKLVLSACSPYFQLLFSQQKEKYPIVILKDVKYQNLKAVVDLIYRGKISVPDDERDEFLDTAKSLQINGLMECKSCCNNEAQQIPSSLEHRSFHDEYRNLLNHNESQEGSCSGELCSRNSSQVSPSDTVILSSNNAVSCELGSQNHAIVTSIDQTDTGSLCNTSSIPNFSIVGKMEEEFVVENHYNLSCSSLDVISSANTIRSFKPNKDSLHQNHVIPFTQGFQGKSTPQDTQESVSSTLQSSDEPSLNSLKSLNTVHMNEGHIEDFSHLYQPRVQSTMDSISQIIDTRKNIGGATLLKEFCYLGDGRQKSFTESDAEVSKNTPEVSKNATEVSKNATEVSKNATEVSKIAIEVGKNTTEVMSALSEITSKPVSQFFQSSVEKKQHWECALSKSSVSTIDQRITPFSHYSNESEESKQNTSITPDLAEIVIDREHCQSHSLGHDLERNVNEASSTQNSNTTSKKSLSSLCHTERHFETTAKELGIDTPKIVLSSPPWFSDPKTQKGMFFPDETHHIFHKSSIGTKELAKYDFTSNKTMNITTNIIDQMSHDQEKYSDLCAAQESVTQVSDNHSIVTIPDSLQYCKFSGDRTPPLQNDSETSLFSPCDSWQELAERISVNPSPTSQIAQNTCSMPGLQGEMEAANDPVIQSKRIKTHNESISDALMIEVETLGIIRQYTETVNDDKDTSFQPSISKKKKKSNICSMCFVEFSSACKLKKHSRTHKKDFKFICKFCSCSFTQESELSFHRCNESEQGLYKCTNCPLVFRNREVHLKHMCSHIQVKREKCEDEFESATELESNIKIDFKKGPFKCSACKKTFEERTIFLKHLQEYEHIGENECISNIGGRYCPLTKIEKKEKVWNGDGSFRCHSCGEGFHRRMALKEHIHVHMAENPLQCYKCCSFFHNKGDLYSHVLVNSGRKPFRCQICYVKFALKNEYGIHCHSHSRNKENQINSD